MAELLLDSDILIDYSRGLEEAAQFLNENSRQSQPAISSMSQMEVLVGARDKREQRKLDKFLQRFHVVKLSEPISDQAVRLLMRYSLSHGLMIPDALVAATALCEGLSLATKNRPDYEFITGLRLFKYP